VKRKKIDDNGEEKGKILMIMEKEKEKD